MSDDAQRLSKVVAAQVPCSRREAEQYIAEGRVRVDGRVADEPQSRVAPGQRVEVETVSRLEPTQPATLLLHKPAGMDGAAAPALLGAAAHWAEDASGIRRVKSHGVGLVALMPLPREASGLVVFSQNHAIVRKLTEEAAMVEQELVAEVEGTLGPGGLERLCRGLVRGGLPLPPARVSWQSETRLRFAVKGIAPHVVPWMCEQVGLRLLGLKRLRIGRVAMAGLPAGQWRYLPAGERF